MRLGKRLYETPEAEPRQYRGDNIKRNFWRADAAKTLVSSTQRQVQTPLRESVLPRSMLSARQISLGLSGGREQSNQRGGKETLQYTHQGDICSKGARKVRLI